MTNLVLDLTAVTYRDLNEKYVEKLREGKEDEAFEIIRPAIVEWPFEASLDSNDPFGELELSQGVELVRLIYERFNSDDAFPLDNFKADLQKWKQRNYVAFKRAARLNQHDVIIEMVKAVVTYKDEPLNSDSAFHILGGIRAIGEAYKRIVTGGN